MILAIAVGDDDDELVTVSKRRLARVAKLLSHLSLEQFDEARLTIPPADDAFGETERMFEQFVLDHAETVQELRRLDRERVKLISHLQAAVTALTTPIIDIWDGVVSLPIVGVLDADRAVEMTERLLARVASSSVRCVIIDVTGVHEIDAVAAAHLVKMIRGARLLGAYALITGIQPGVAQTLEGLRDGLALDVTTKRSLRDGLRHCILRLRLRRPTEGA